MAGDYEFPFDADNDVPQLLAKMQDGDEWAKDRLESLLEGTSRLNAYERMLAGLRAVSETPVEEMKEAVDVLAKLFEHDLLMASELQIWFDEIRDQHDQDVKLGDFDETEFQQNLDHLIFLESNFAAALAQEPDESRSAIPEVPDSFFKNLSNMTPTSATSAIISAIHQAGVRKTSVDEGVGRNLKHTGTTDFGRAIQLGGLVSDQETLSRELPLPAIVAPGPVDLALASLGEPALDFRWSNEGHINYGREIRRLDPRGLLDQFLKLADGSDEDVLSFASTWGRLQGNCEHRMPYTRCNRCESPRMELISEWRILAQVMRAILNIAANLHQQLPGNIEDWSICLDNDYSVDGWSAVRESLAGPTDGHAIEAERKIVGAILDTMVAQSGIRPTFRWVSDHPEIRESPEDSLFGALARQMMHAVSRSEGTFVCHACGSLFIPKRKPQAGRNSYCSACGPTGPKKDWATKNRQSKKVH